MYAYKQGSKEHVVGKAGELPFRALVRILNPGDGGLIVLDCFFFDPPP